MPKLVLKKLAQHYLRGNGHSGNIFVGETTLEDIGLESLYDICSDSSGNLYATDDTKHVVVKITPNGSVRIYAGVLGVSGNDGNTVKSGSTAKFNTPRGIVCDKNGVVYVADSGNNQIRKIIPSGTYTNRDGVVRPGIVSLFCGSTSGSSGYSNTYPFLLDNPSDVALDNSSNLYVADTGNNCIRRFSIGIRKAITIAGNGDESAGDVSGYTVDARLDAPISIDVNPRGELYIADSGNYKVKKTRVNLYTGNFAGDGTVGSTVGATTKFSELRSIKCDKSGNIFASDYSEDYSGRLLRLDENGKSFFIKSFGYFDTFCLDNSGNIFAVENGYTTLIYSSSSSSSESSYSSSSSSSYSSSSSSDSTNSSDSSISSDSSASSGYLDSISSSSEFGESLSSVSSVLEESSSSTSYSSYSGDLDSISSLTSSSGSSFSRSMSSNSSSSESGEISSSSSDSDSISSNNSSLSSSNSSSSIDSSSSESGVFGIGMAAIGQSNEIF